MNYYDDDLYSTSRQGTTEMGGYPYMPMSQVPTQPMGMGQVPTQPMGQMEQIPLPATPTGVPAGGIVAPMPMGLGTSVTEGIQFVAGFLKTQIGKSMRVEFLIGTNGPLVDRVGTLLAVGTSYIILRPVGSQAIVMCDLYSIKFVTVFPGSNVMAY